MCCIYLVAYSRILALCIVAFRQDHLEHTRASSESNDSRGFRLRNEFSLFLSSSSHSDTSIRWLLNLPHNVYPSLFSCTFCTSLSTGFTTLEESKNRLRRSSISLSSARNGDRVHDLKKGSSVSLPASYGVPQVLEVEASRSSIPDQST